MSILGVMDKNVFWYSDLNGAKFFAIFARLLDFERKYLGNGTGYKLADCVVGSAMKT